MTKPETNIEKLLAPITTAAPAGRDLFYDPIYSQIKAARTPPELQEMDRQAWMKVRDLTSGALGKHSKDLQLAVWWLEAEIHLEGFGGLDKGLQTLRGLIEQFWSDLFPAIDKDDPAEPLYARTLVMEWVNSKLPEVVKAVPLTGDTPGYGLLHYEVTQSTGELKEALIKDGDWPDRERFQAAMEALPLTHWESVQATLEACQEALVRLGEACDQVFRQDSKPILRFHTLREALEDCLHLTRLTAKKIQAAQPPVDSAPTGQPTPAAPTAAEPAAKSAPRPEPLVPAAVPPADTPTSQEEAFDRVFELVRYLLEDNPFRPIPYMLSRAIAWGNLIGFEKLTPRTVLPAPSSELRHNLKELFVKESWLKLLGESEEALSNPTNWVWLDLHRYALVAMEKLGAEYSRAALAIGMMLRSLLEAHPDLPNLEMEDGTPSAGAETKEWLDQLAEGWRRSGALADTEPESPAPVPIEIPLTPPAAAGDGLAEAFEQASRLLQKKQVGEALLVLQKSIGEADSGRTRFLGKLQLAEICMQAKRQNLAYPILNELAEIIDEFRLEEWEGKDVVGRVWADLVRCCRQFGRGFPERKQRADQVFDRLCRLDIARALEVEKD